MKPKPLIVIVEDNAMYRELLTEHLRQSELYEVLSFPNAESCLEGLHQKPSAMILDQQLDPPSMGGKTGLDLLLELRKRGLDAPALFLTGHEAVQPAAEILKAGAYAYMRKEEMNLTRVSEQVAQMVEWHEIQQQMRTLERKARELRRRMGLLVLVLGGLVLSVL